MRRAARRDSNEADIVDTLRRLGWSVECVSRRGFPDLVCGRGGAGGSVVLCEVKGRLGRLTPDQIAWRAAWRGPAPILLRSIEDAVALSNSQVFGLV